MPLLRGMKDWSTDQVKLKFALYLDEAALPPVPDHFGHVGQAQPPVDGGWGMLGNDRVGNCTIAGIAHAVQTWRWATKKAVPAFDTNSIVQQYMALSGGKDDGLDPVEVADWMRKTGVEDAAGQCHKISTYAAIDNLHYSVIAAYLYGVCGLGLGMPKTAEHQFMAGQVWDDTSGKPVGGHFVPLVGVNSAGNLVVVTWGRLQAMTPAWFRKYFIGAIAYISEDYLLATGKSPEGLRLSSPSMPIWRMSLPRPSSLRDALYMRRINELMRDGYLTMVRHDDSMRLTNKGMNVLMACADRPRSRPLPPPRPKPRGEVT